MDKKSIFIENFKMIAVLMIIIIFNGASAENIDLRLCERNQPCSFGYKYEPENVSSFTLHWTTGGLLVGKCEVRDNQILTPPCKGLISNHPVELLIEKETDLTYYVTTANLTVVNQDKNNKLSDGQWSLSVDFGNNTLERLSTWDLQIFEKPKDIACEHISSNTFLEIWCYISMSYPDSTCEFNIRRSNTTFINFSPPEHSSTQISSDPIYFSTNCSTKIPVEHVAQGKYEIDISIFPNISTRNNNTVVTVNKNVLIVNPRISLEKCSDQVEAGGNVTCTCKRRDKSNIKTTLFWLVDGVAIKGSEYEAILNDLVHSVKSGYICMSENELGWITKLIHNPRIQYSNKKRYCEGNKCFFECYGDGEVCKTEKVYSCIPENLSINDIMKRCQKSKEDDPGFRNHACDCVFKSIGHITTETIPDETSLKTIVISFGIAGISGFIIVMATLLFVIQLQLSRKRPRIKSHDKNKCPFYDTERKK